MHAKRHLALCIAKEHTILGQPYQFQADITEKKVSDAEHGMGNLQDSIQTMGFQLVPTTPRSVHRSPRPCSGSAHKRKLNN